MKSAFVGKKEFYVIKIHGTTKKIIFFKFKNSIKLLPYFPAHKTHFFPQKCDLNSTCVLYAVGSIILLFPNLNASSENNHEDDCSGSDDDFLGFYDE